MRAGWDIGGAHVKLAYVQNGRLHVQQWDCPLWHGLARLSAVLKMAKSIIPSSVDRHNVTMTGEMADIFHTHEEGVEKIIHVFIETVSNEENVRFYSTKGLLNYRQAINNKSLIASANWLASANLLAQHTGNCIFMDIGSTTTDVLQINDSGLMLNGETDFDRLITGELVYTGVVRSCVNTLCREIPYKGRTVPLMAEQFSTTADVYRILQWLPTHADYGPTPDGQAKDIPSSMRRLARMIGRDYCRADHDTWIEVCEYLAGQQMQMIEASVISMIRHHPAIDKIVAAGVGAFLVRIIAERMFLKCIDFTDCIIPPDVIKTPMASECAPAVALVFTDLIAE